MPSLNPKRREKFNVNPFVQQTDYTTPDWFAKDCVYEKQRR